MFEISARRAAVSRDEAGDNLGDEKNTVPTMMLLRAFRADETDGTPVVLGRLAKLKVSSVKHQLHEENRYSADLVRAECLIHDPELDADLITAWLGIPGVRFVAVRDEGERR